MTEIYEELAGIFGGRATRNVQMKNLHLAPPNIVAPYAKIDAEVTLDLWRWQNVEISKQSIHDIIEFEQKLLPTTLEMTMRGVQVDIDLAEKTKTKVDRKRKRLQNKLNKMAGFDVNIMPSKSLTELIAPVQDKDGKWYAKDGTPLNSTPGGKAQLNKDALMRMRMKEGS